MSSEESKEKKEETAHANCFEMFSEMMSKCCKGEGNFDCSDIMKAMKNQSCCSPKVQDTKTGCC